MRTELHECWIWGYWIGDSYCSNTDPSHRPAYNSCGCCQRVPQKMMSSNGSMPVATRGISKDIASQGLWQSTVFWYLGFVHCYAPSFTWCVCVFRGNHFDRQSPSQHALFFSLIIFVRFCGWCFCFDAQRKNKFHWETSWKNIATIVVSSTYNTVLLYDHTCVDTYVCTFIKLSEILYKNLRRKFSPIIKVLVLLRTSIIFDFPILGFLSSVD